MDRIKLVSVTEMQQIERQADASGLSYAEMMENAGRGVAEQVHAAYSHKCTLALALVGSGNNGGDALVALTHLAGWGWKVSACQLRPRPAADPLVSRVLQSGGEVFDLQSNADPRLAAFLQQGGVLLDGVLGTGARLPLKEELADTFNFLRQAIVPGEGRVHVVAVDCPSGVDCDTGDRAPETLPAEMTVSMAAVKQGLLRLPAYECVGELRVVGIGALAGLPAWEAVSRFVAGDEWVRHILPPRPLDAHKGTFGTALVVAGSLSYTGAAWLAGQAAYRIGAGLVTLAVPEPLHAALAGQFPEATWLLLPEEEGVIAPEAAATLLDGLGRATAMLIGPGFGLEKSTQTFLERLLPLSPERQRVEMGFLPSPAGQTANLTLPGVVLDADGLKLLSRLPDWPQRLPSPAVLTPHPGEMAVLTGLSTAELQTDRLETARRFSQQWGHVLVLKGAFTVVADSEGSLAVIPVATPALARAGTGDVLAGLIVGLRAQGVPPFDAAVAGAWIHAQAGLQAVQELGSAAAVLAGDVLRAVPRILARLAAG